MKKSLLKLVLIVCISLLISCDNPSAPEPKSKQDPPKQELKTNIIAGEKLAKACESCHGKTGLSIHNGVPYIAGLSAEYLKTTMVAYKNHTRKHRQMRLALVNIKDDDLNNLSGYYAKQASNWKGGNSLHTQKPSQGFMQRGERVAAICVTCHGKNGNSEKSGIPSLAGLQVDYFVNAFENYVSELRKDTIMQHFKNVISWQQLQDVAQYYSRQKRIRGDFPLPGNPAQGEKLAKQCTGCHGVHGQTFLPDMPNLAAQNATYLMKAMVAYRKGKRQHAVMQREAKSLTDIQVRDLASYFARMESGQMDLSTDRSTFDPVAQGASLAINCQGCHGEQGNSVTPGVPSINGFSLHVFQSAIKQYIDGNRKDRMMQAFAKQLSASQIEKLALYYAQADMTSRKKSPAKIIVEESLLSQCSACHGEQGQSTREDVPTIAGQDFNYLVKALQDYQTGLRIHQDMQNAVAEKTLQAIQSLARYYSAQIPQAQKQYELEPPDVLAEKKCDRCHGPRGFSSQANVPRIAGQSERYLYNSLLAYKNGDRIHSIMHAMADVLTISEMEAVAKYYAMQTAKK